MSNLAIKGHATRGKEVIEILEMLGGVNNKCLYGVTTGLYYFIDYGEICSCESVPNTYIIFTLEEFLEKYPYKVGDKVLYHETIAIVRDMRWDGREIVYTVECKEELWDTTIFYLQPYKEETMEEKENSVVVNNEHKQLKVSSLRYDKVQLMIDDKYELKQEGDVYYIVRRQPQYPKTYKECFKICFGDKHHIIQVVGLDGLDGNKDLFENFIKLKICRDAYWKIAGKEMGLGKPWKPDWYDEEQVKYLIGSWLGTIQCLEENYVSHPLAFPTEEMRDKFYENFKELIEECKELL